MKFFVGIFLIALSSVCASENFTIGFKEVIQSKTLNEQREVFVHLPDSYNSSSQSTYPVIYALDEPHFKYLVGVTDWLSRGARVIPEYIIVNVVNTDRYRDFSPSKPKDEPNSNAGGADKFTAFIANELIPHINKKYRTSPFKVLTGHSFGGLVTLHTLITKPDSFNAYVAMSPFVSFDDTELVNRYAKKLKQSSQIKAFLLMTMGNEAELLPAFARLEEILKTQAPDSLKWQSYVYEDESHMSTPSRTIHPALNALTYYQGWRVNKELLNSDFAKIESHFSQLSKQLGYTVEPTPAVINAYSENLLELKRIDDALAFIEGEISKKRLTAREINQFAYQLLWRGEANTAVTVFKRNIELYPDIANLYDSLAEGYESIGDLSQALANQQKALDLAKQQKLDNVDYFQNRLMQLSSRQPEKRLP